VPLSAETKACLLQAVCAVSSSLASWSVSEAQTKAAAAQQWVEQTTAVPRRKLAPYAELAAAKLHSAAHSAAIALAPSWEATAPQRQQVHQTLQQTAAPLRSYGAQVRCAFRSLTV
jgi:hypothetical protein